MKNSSKNIHKPLVVQIASFLGGISALAKKLQISRQAVQQWTINGIPPARAIEIEKITHGKFKASQLIDN